MVLWVMGAPIAPFAGYRAWRSCKSDIEQAENKFNRISVLLIARAIIDGLYI
jgi:hypothetical protein